MASFEIREIQPTETAIKLVADLADKLPKDGYFLMGIHEKEMKWDRNIRDISRVSPTSVKNFGEKSSEDLSNAQRAFFGNLHTCTKPENLNNYNKGARIIPDESDPSISKLVLMGMKKNTLNQTVVKITAVLFREYTEEELEEVRAEKARQEAKANGVDLSATETKITDMFDTLMSSF